jgi:small-conductance mechanosensitive channel
MAVKITRSAISRSMARQTKILKVEPTQYNFLKHFLSGMIYLAGFAMVIYIIPSLRALSVSMLAGAGVLAVIVGFASQQAFSNIVSGVFLVIFKPFRVGDWVKIGTDQGLIEDITLRHTVVRNFENNRLVIPNSIISNEKIENFNLTDDLVCKLIDFSVSFDCDLDKAMKIMREESENHKLCIDNRKNESVKSKPKVEVFLMGFTDSSVHLRAYAWAKNPLDGFYMSTDLNKSIKQRFDREGIEIPYPYRTIVMKKEGDNAKRPFV